TPQRCNAHGEDARILALTMSPGKARTCADARARAAIAAIGTQTGTSNCIHARSGTRPAFLPCGPPRLSSGLIGANEKSSHHRGRLCRLRSGAPARLGRRLGRDYRRSGALSRRRGQDTLSRRASLHLRAPALPDAEGAHLSISQQLLSVAPL